MKRLRYSKRYNWMRYHENDCQKIDDSEVVIVPKELLDRMSLRVGDQLQITETEDGITLRPVADTFDRQMKAAHEVMDKYKAGLQKLAE